MPPLPRDLTPLPLPTGYSKADLLAGLLVAALARQGVAARALVRLRMNESGRRLETAVSR